MALDERAIADIAVVVRSMPALWQAEPEGLQAVLRRLELRIARRERQVQDDRRQMGDSSCRNSSSLVRDLHR